MGLMSYTFKSPVDTETTIKAINKVVSSMGGRTKRDGNVIIAWLMKQGILPQRFTFFVRSDNVKVVTRGSLFDVCNKILTELKEVC